ASAGSATPSTVPLQGQTRCYVSSGPERSFMQDSTPCAGIGLLRGLGFVPLSFFPQQATRNADPMSPDNSIRVPPKIRATLRITVRPLSRWINLGCSSQGLTWLSSVDASSAGKGSAIALIATYLLGESAPWSLFFGEPPDLFQPWSFDVTCRDAVLGAAG